MWTASLRSIVKGVSKINYVDDTFLIELLEVYQRSTVWTTSLS